LLLAGSQVTVTLALLQDESPQRASQRSLRTAINLILSAFLAVSALLGKQVIPIVYLSFIETLTFFSDVAENATQHKYA
jgi:hypothetical protein